MTDHTRSIRSNVLTESRLRDLARRRLEPGPTEAVFDPRSGRTWGPSDWDLNPEMIADFAVMEPARPAAVLVPIVARSELTVLFTLRPEGMKQHSGQISFPGGKVEPDDPDHAAAALREAEEEIGLAREHIEPLGFLDTYRTGTGYSVAPLVAIVSPAFRLSVDRREVAEVFEVPLAFLMDEANHQKHTRPWRGRDRHYYAMPYGDRFIWGATAGMLKNLHQRLFGS
jgi:8-oxo-dGTP pyrophosphatase MutT (NUDIX family)